MLFIYLFGDAGLDSALIAYLHRMQYFLYISDAKIDMLFPQIPGGTREKITKELGFDLRFLKGNTKAEITPYSNPVSKLLLIEKYLGENDFIGTIEQDKGWISGELKIRCVNLGNGGIIFIGKSGAISIGLGGSEHNLVGNIQPDKIFRSQSNPISMEKNLDEYFINSKNLFDSTSASKEANDRILEQTVWDYALSDIMDCNYHEPFYTVKYLAKRLAVSNAYVDFGGTKFVLATPLYISLVD